LTDVAPPIEARSAGWLAIGGSAVPGPVAQFGTTVTRWTGSAFESQADGAPAPVVVCDAGVPGAIRQLVDAWAGERGWQLAAGSAAERARLVVRHLPDADATDRALRAYRDGWSLVGRGALAAARGTTDVWLAAADGRALVGTAPGLVTIGLREIESIGGELASFAVAWSRLLDERALAPLGVVPWSERQAAGELAWQAPSASAARAPAAPDRYPLAWQLACAAALLAALGLALRGGLTNFPLRAAPAARTMRS